MATPAKLPSGLLADLRAESEDLDRLVADLPPATWAAPTPAPGWTVAHQIAHLAWTDGQALLAATEPEAFRREAERFLAEGAEDVSEAGGAAHVIDEAAEEGARLPHAELLRRWRAGRAALAHALTAALPGPRLPWYGTSMSPASMATARLMETWAHGEDVADALGVARQPTPRLRHIVHLGVRARDFAYAVHGLRPPAGPFRVELRGPGGEVWAHGPADAGQKVTGDAYDFCRLVTQRVHRDDADVHAEGADADQWLDIAQAFAGPPGAGREPGQAGRPGAGREPGEARA
ncbi:TIGR03084 family metal-binding protein [Streptomyces reniochalinae]|uniref:TIGR03084 family protein n=1 Tax=Streptomyces reniochalinae TaxID=2250578 RepID=A0A367EIX3_9ACTN|nr:TIGR03084 family metal-binding protein [Streptomyces reniochalinae]RCG18001.1 TIGR03084 family protein [Streptomyces reniochalinae]